MCKTVKSCLDEISATPNPTYAAVFRDLAGLASLAALSNVAQTVLTSSARMSNSSCTQTLAWIRPLKANQSVLLVTGVDALLDSDSEVVELLHGVLPNLISSTLYVYIIMYNHDEATQCREKRGGKF